MSNVKSEYKHRTHGYVAEGSYDWKDRNAMHYYGFLERIHYYRLYNGSDEFSDELLHRLNVDPNEEGWNEILRLIEEYTIDSIGKQHPLALYLLRYKINFGVELDGCEDEVGGDRNKPSVKDHMLAIDIMYRLGLDWDDEAAKKIFAVIDGTIK